MGSVNKVILVGNLGRDAEVRYTPGGAAGRELQHCHDRELDVEGRREARADRVASHRAVGQERRTLQPYLTKGKQIYVEGRLQTRQWEKDGQKHYTTEVKADRIVLLGGGGRGGERVDRGERRLRRSDGQGRRRSPTTIFRSSIEGIGRLARVND